MRRVPSYQGTAPLPVTKAPPWIHTMTGRRPSSTAGVWTLRYRQSSSQFTLFDESSEPSPTALCGAHGLKRLASRVPSHGLADCGGRKRRGPTGGAA
jgi:hypothetical protein